MQILAPYEKYLTVLVRQEDSLCLYTQDLGERSGALFAAVQILSSGVAFTVYDPGADYAVFECLPVRIKAFYKGENRFLITRINAGIIAELKELLLALFGTYSLGKYYYRYEAGL